jgi:hypothetical protein
LNQITSINVSLLLVIILFASATGSQPQVSFQSLTNKMTFFVGFELCNLIQNSAFFKASAIGVHQFGFNALILDFKAFLSVSVNLYISSTCLHDSGFPASVQSHLCQ